MPTYRNKSGSPKTIGGQTLSDGEIKRILSWPTGDIDQGIELIDEMPMYNPIILAEKITESKTIYIPGGETRFTIHFFAEKGEPTIYYNSKENKPCLKLYHGARWNERLFERVIDKLVVELGPENVLWMLIEKI